MTFIVESEEKILEMFLITQLKNYPEFHIAEDHKKEFCYLFYVNAIHSILRRENTNYNNLQTKS
jgi:hypothetical protein